MKEDDWCSVASHFEFAMCCFDVMVSTSAKTYPCSTFIWHHFEPGVEPRQDVLALSSPQSRKPLSKVSNHHGYMV